MSILASHILDAVKENIVFSDIRIEQDEPLAIRTPMGWKRKAYVVTLDDLRVFLAEIAIGGHWKEKVSSQSAVESSLYLDDLRLRCTAFMLRAGHRMGIVIRKLPESPLSLEETGLPIFVENFTKAPAGLVLVAGPTGAGKTTTLGAMLERINETREDHIVTIEEPIEYLFKNKLCIFTQREVGTDVRSFSDGMVQAMRQCPNVIMIGEIRDVDTAHAAFRAADSGHLVLASTHANTGVGAILKLLSFFGPESESKVAALARLLVGVVAQMLLTSTDRSRFVLASEVINCRDPVLVPLLAEGKFKQVEDAMAAGHAGQLNSCVSFNRSLAQLVASGAIDAARARAASPQPSLLRL